MKTIPQFKIAFSIVSLLLIILTVSSCKNEKEIDPATTTTTSSTSGNGNAAKGKLMFHLHTYLDNNEVDLYNADYTTDDGRKVSLALAQLYISDIQLVKPDGSLINVSNKIILMEHDVETYIVGDVAVGNYKAIRFKIGVNAATNLLEPAQSNDSALLNRSEMWFGNTPQPDGYVFMNVRGKIDTSDAADNTKQQMQQFEYKIGTNNYYTQVIMPDRNYSVYQEQTSFVHVLVDYYKLFNGVQLNNPSNLSVLSASDNNNALSTKIAGNIPLMFKYEE